MLLRWELLVIRKAIHECRYEVNWKSLLSDQFLHESRSALKDNIMLNMYTLKGKAIKMAKLAVLYTYSWFS